jgi:hypothetical protein
MEQVAHNFINFIDNVVAFGNTTERYVWRNEHAGTS